MHTNATYFPSTPSGFIDISGATAMHSHDYEQLPSAYDFAAVGTGINSHHELDHLGYPLHLHTGTLRDPYAPDTEVLEVRAPQMQQDPPTLPPRRPPLPPRPPAFPSREPYHSEAPDHFEVPPPAYNQLEHTRTSAWFCCQCQYRTGNNLVEGPNGFRSFATCRSCRHTVCNGCLTDRVLQPVPAKDVQMLKVLTNSRRTQFVTFCPQCGFSWGADVGRPRLAKKLQKGAKVFNNWMIVKSLGEPAPLSRNSSREFDRCYHCSESFAPDWVCFRYDSGTFNPAETAMRAFRAEFGFPPVS